MIITGTTEFYFLRKIKIIQNLIALHIATKLIKGDNTVTKRKVIQLEAESPVIILP